MTWKTFNILLMSCLIVGLQACNHSSRSTTQTTETNNALDIATAQPDTDPTTFDPTTMTINLAQLVGAGADGEPVSIENGDTITSVLVRLSN